MTLANVAEAFGLLAPECPVPHTEPPVYDTYTDSIDAAENGAYTTGLGVDYDWDYVRSNAVQTTVHASRTGSWTARSSPPLR